MPKSIALALLSVASVGFADVVAPKTFSGLFTPVAYDERRSLSIDRSNFTYAASGINSGVLQLETSLVEYLQDDKIPGVDGQLKQFAFGTATLRMGILDNFEMKTTVGSYVSARFKDGAGNVTKDNGLGDTLFEARYTFVGNGGEAVGVAFMPYVKLPTNTLQLYNDEVEGGAQLPITWTIDEHFAWCFAPGFDLNYNGQIDSDYDANPFFATAFWATAIPETLFLFNEWYVKKDTGRGKDDLLSYVGVGGVWIVTRDFGIDFGVNFGLSESAPDLYCRTGITYRF